MRATRALNTPGKSNGSRSQAARRRRPGAGSGSVMAWLLLSRPGVPRAGRYDLTGKFRAWQPVRDESRTEEPPMPTADRPTRRGAAELRRAVGLLAIFLLLGTALALGGYVVFRVYNRPADDPANFESLDPALSLEAEAALGKPAPP